MYGVLTSQRDATVEVVPRLGPSEGFALDVERLIERLPGAALLWLCAPNNPTGAPEPLETIDRILTAAGAIDGHRPVIVVDEAYAEFWHETAVPLRDRFVDLVVIRTLSKAFALSGIRVGYGVAVRPTIERLERVRPPGSISTPSATLAAAALRRPDLARENAAGLSAEREWLVARLGEIGRPPFPSVTNFLLLPVGDHADADALAERLLRRGIVPRTFGSDHPLRGQLRLTVRSRAENERLLDALEREPVR